MSAGAAPPLVRRMHALEAYLSQDFLGGPRVLKLAWVIDFQKAGTFAFVGALMWIFRNGSPAAWTYLALHGSYGFCWLLKDLAFPDAGWQKRVTFGGAAMSFLLVLGPYWLLPVLLISPVLGARPQPSPALLAGAIALHTLGVALMLAADAQKHFTLRLRPGLITDGLFRYVRHPNYLGEMMLYAAYALVVRHWIAWAILLWVWTAVFWVNMRMKEASLSRHPGWAAYRARTGMLLPRLLPPAPPADEARLAAAE